MIEQSININRVDDAIALFGNFDSNVDLIRNKLNVHVTLRDGEIKIGGDPEDVLLATKTIEGLMHLINKGELITDQNVNYMMSLVERGSEDRIKTIATDVVAINAKNAPIKAKTTGQQRYVNAIRKNTITLGIGPAGTGKTFLAVALAAKAFKANEVQRIILTRPAVEAGEKLGFLPGDLQEKVDPYLRPLHDALFEMFGPESYAKHLERGNIEIAPLAYMRGRTLENSFIILDEAQNTTHEQMKMFLTRLGLGSKIVITGDVTQIDLPDSNSSGLVQAAQVLKDVEDIGIINLTEHDVVRHKLVQKIVIAYDEFNKNAKNAKRKTE